MNDFSKTYYFLCSNFIFLLFFLKIYPQRNPNFFGHSIVNHQECLLTILLICMPYHFYFLFSSLLVSKTCYLQFFILSFFFPFANSNFIKFYPFFLILIFVIFLYFFFLKKLIFGLFICQWSLLMINSLDNINALSILIFFNLFSWLFKDFYSSLLCCLFSILQPY